MFCFHCRYYEFDSVIVREILGKKLTSRFRNSLDDISEKTHIPLRSCRRQVDLSLVALSAVTVSRETCQPCDMPTLWHVIVVTCQPWDMSALWHVIVVTCQLWDMSALWHVIVVTCQPWDMSALWHVIVVTCQPWDMSALWHVIVVTCHCCDMSAVRHVSLVTCHCCDMSAVRHVSLVTFQPAVTCQPGMLALWHVSLVCQPYDMSPLWHVSLVRCQLALWHVNVVTCQPCDCHHYDMSPCDMS